MMTITTKIPGFRRNDEDDDENWQIFVDATRRDATRLVENYDEDDDDETST